MATLTQDQIRTKMRRLDDVFHRTMIALERLEVFTEAVRLNGETNPDLIATAIRTDRDIHDDNANPPTRDSFYGEVQLQLSALLFQTKFDDKELFFSSVKYFLGDLLEWYGGRNDSIPYNGVDAYFLPIVSSLSQQVATVAEVMEVVEKYVAVIPGIASFSDEEKTEAIARSIEKIILVMEENHEKEHDHEHEESHEEEVAFTVHKRGDRIDGYKRLMNAMLEMYDEAMPAIVVYRTVLNFMPEVAEAVPAINEDSIAEFIASKVDETEEIPAAEEEKVEEPLDDSPKDAESEAEKEPEPEKEQEPEKEPEKEPETEETSEDDAQKKKNIIEKVLDIFK